MEQSSGLWHGHQRTDFGATTRLTEYRHVFWIAAELSDVDVKPTKRGDQVENAKIAGFREFRATQSRQIQMAEDIQPVIECDDNRVTLSRQVGAVIDRVAARAVREPTTMKPDHDRTFMVSA